MPFLDFASAFDFYRQPDSAVKELSSSGGVSAGDGNGASQGAQPGGAGAAPQGAADTSGLAPGRTGTLSDRILSPLETGTGTARQTSQGLSSSFQEAAGPSRTYGSSGAQEALQAAIGHGANDTQKTAAKGFLGASYGGPQGIEAQKAADLQSVLDRLSQYGGSAGEGSKLRSLVAQAIPGTTGGEQAMEAQTLLSDPGYQKRRQEAQGAAQKASSDEAAMVKAAEAYARQRQQEEAGIASGSRDFLVGQRGQIEGSLADALAKAQAEESGLSKSYQDIMAGGALPQDIAHQFETTTEAGKVSAQKKWDEIMAKYPTVANLPLLQMQSRKGDQEYGLPQEYYDAHPEILQDPNREALQQSLYDRQKELETEFSPQNTWYGPQEGEFSKYKPLYFTDTNPMDTEVPTWQGEDPRNYLSFQQSNATRETVATPEQQQKFNTINELLGEVDRLAESDPFQGASILADVEQFIKDEDETLARWDTAPTQAGEEWQRTLYDLRRKVEHAKTQNNLMGTIMQVTGGLLSTTPAAPLGWGLLAEGTRKKVAGVGSGPGIVPQSTSVS